MQDGHGDPLRDAAAYDALPDEAKQELLSDVARLQANLPQGEIMPDEPIGIGATSRGFLVIKTAHAAYQLLADGSTVKVTRGPDGMLIRTYRDRELVDNPPDSEMK